MKILKHIWAYAVSLFTGCVISLIVTFFIAYTIDKGTTLGLGMVIILFYVYVVALSLTVLPFLCVLSVIHRYKTLRAHILGGIITGIPLWGIALYAALSEKSVFAIFCAGYFILLGVVCGGVYYWIITQDERDLAAVKEMLKDPHKR